jgi:hypothetical protein
VDQFSGSGCDELFSEDRLMFRECQQHVLDGGNVPKNAL